MDRKEFLEKFDTLKQQHEELKVNTIRRVVELENEFYKKYVAGSDTDINYQKLIAVEELGELQHEVTKDLRGKLDHGGILEELADVHIALDTIQRLYDISDYDLDVAMEVKLLRNKEAREKNEGSPC